MTFTKYLSIKKKTKINPRFESAGQNLVKLLIAMNIDLTLRVFQKKKNRFDFENLCYYEKTFFTISIFVVRTKKHATVYMGCGTTDDQQPKILREFFDKMWDPRV